MMAHAPGQVGAMQRWNTDEAVQVAGGRLLGRLSIDDSVVRVTCLPNLCFQPLLAMRAASASDCYHGGWRARRQ